MPVPPQYDPVEVFDCRKDNVCPSGTRFCMSEKDYKNLIANTIKDRTYQKQLLNLLESISK